MQALTPQQQFYIARANQQEGPMALDEIVSRVINKTLDVTDYLYAEEQKEWVMIMAFTPLVERLKAMRPEVPPVKLTSLEKKADASSKNAVPEWFVLKGDGRFGPFSRAELIRMLQDKSLFEFDYVWTAKMTSWERLASLPEFSPDSVRLLRESGVVGLNEVFFRRRHARAPYGASLLIHNNKTVFKGKSLEVSEGGAGLVIQAASLQAGDKLHLHFAPGDGLPPFNAKCEVVSKRSVNAGEKDGSVQYGVKFFDLSAHTAEVIGAFTQKAVA